MSQVYQQPAVARYNVAPQGRYINSLFQQEPSYYAPQQQYYNQPSTRSYQPPLPLPPPPPVMRYTRPIVPAPYGYSHQPAQSYQTYTQPAQIESKYQTTYTQPAQIEPTYQTYQQPATYQSYAQPPRFEPTYQSYAQPAQLESKYQSYAQQEQQAQLEEQLEQLNLQRAIEESEREALLAPPVIPPRRKSAQPSAMTYVPASFTGPSPPKLTQTPAQPSYAPAVRIRAGYRPSPAQSAADTAIGTVMQGQDGRNYIVTERKNGVHYWKAL